MTTINEARKLANLMVSIGKLSGRRVVALLSDMNQPLGNAVGNSLEVQEAIQTLRGGGPADFREHCLTVASHLLLLGQKAPDLKEGRSMAEKSLSEGRALRAFRSLVEAQGGDVSYVDKPGKFTPAPFIETIKAERAGYLMGINAREIGETALDLGAGRTKKSDPIDHAVGILIHHKVGDRLEPGQALFTVHANSQVKMKMAIERLLAAHQWSSEPCSPLPLFYGVIGE